MKKTFAKNRTFKLLALLIVALVVLLSFTSCAKNETRITDISQVDGKEIGIGIGSMYEDIVTEHFPKSTIRYYNSTADLGVALDEGLVDAIICDASVAIAMVEENENLAIIGEPLSTDKYDFAASMMIKLYDSESSSLKKTIYDTFVAEGRGELFLDGFKTTAIISILSILIGGVIGFSYISYCWSKVKIGLAGRIGKKFVWIVKATPILVFLMILYYVIFARTGLSAVTVSIIGFSISFIASLESILYKAISEISRGEEEAALILGYTKSEIYFKIVVPQMFTKASDDIKNEIVNLVQATSIVGYIAVQDITKVSDIIRGRTFDAFFPLFATTILYFLLCWGIVAILRILEHNHGYRRRTPDRILKGVERR